MVADKRFLDDLARLAGGAASLASTIGRQVSSDLKEKAQSYGAKLDPSRDEIERMQAMISKYRIEQEDMKKRIAALEARLDAKTPKTTAKKPAKPSKRK